MIAIDSISSIPKSKSLTSSLKFVLYLKNKEVTEINKVFYRVMSLPKPEQKIWREQYGELVDYALDLFVDDSNSVLNKLSLDAEVLDLSHQLVNSLQDAIRSAEVVLGVDTTLNS